MPSQHLLGAGHKAAPNLRVIPWGDVTDVGWYCPPMPHYVFNFSDGDRQGVHALLRAKLWGVGYGEPHGDALGPGDVAVIYLPAPASEFVARAELASAVHEWTPAEADAYPGDAARGVVLSHVEAWDPAVPMDAVVRRIDPTASNKRVQGNAAGFQMDVVRITEDEYLAVQGLSREARQR